MKSLGRRGATPADDTEVLRKYVEQLPAALVLDGQLVTGVILSGSQVVRIRHTLGRAYVGGAIVGVSAATAVQVQTPQAASASGVPTTRELVVGTTAAVAQDTAVNVWVF